MSYLVLARKWRPQGFPDMVGQQHIARVLTNAIESGRIAHCYLFTGVRGVGKTSAARILAKALNCLEGPTPAPCNVCARCQEINEARSIDVYEIDGASNRGIDEVRQIIENVRYQPAAARFKVYIIDEVHQVTRDAFNALLKTLEEPPPFAKFILATTEVHRLPETILSRCQRFDFRRIGVQDIQERLRRIAETEGLNITDGALTLISRAAEGSMRDAQSLLEQVLSFAAPAEEGGAVDEALLRDILGVAERRVLYDISSAVLAGDAAACLNLVAEVATDGVDLAVLSRELVEHFRNLLVVRLSEGTAGSPSDAGNESGARRLTDLTDEEIARLRAQVEAVDPETLIGYYRFIVQGDEIVARSPYPRFDLEVSLVRVATLPHTVDIAGAIEELRLLERKLEEAGPGGQGRAVGRGLPSAEGLEPARETGHFSEPEPSREPASSRHVPPESASPEPETPGTGLEAPTHSWEPPAPELAPPTPPPEPVPADSDGPDAEGDTDPEAREASAPEWNRFLEFVAGEQRVLATFLQQGRLIEITDTGVKLDLQGLYRSHVEKRENMALLEEYIERFFQRRLAVTLMSVATAEGDSGPDGEERESGADIIDEAVRIFGGTVK